MSGSWLDFQYLGGEFVGGLDDGKERTVVSGLEVVLLHFFVVKGYLPGAHVPTNGHDLIVSQFQAQTQKHDDTLLAMTYGQVAVIFPIDTSCADATLIAGGLADVVKQRGDDQGIV